MGCFFLCVSLFGQNRNYLILVKTWPAARDHEFIFNTGQKLNTWDCSWWRVAIANRGFQPRVENSDKPNIFFQKDARYVPYLPSPWNVCIQKNPNQMENLWLKLAHVGSARPPSDGSKRIHRGPVTNRIKIVHHLTTPGQLVSVIDLFIYFYCFFGDSLWVHLTCFLMVRFNSRSLTSQ